MNLIKKQTAGSFISLAALVFSIVSMIVYKINISSVGYFQNASVPAAVTYHVAGIVLLLFVIVLAQLNVNGAAGKVLDICSGIMRIVTPALFIGALMALLGSRVEGFAFIFFSNEEVLHEVQTAENMASTHGTIANMVLLGVTAVLAMAAAFFSMKKEK